MDWPFDCGEGRFPKEDGQSLPCWRHWNWWNRWNWWNWWNWWNRWNR